MIINVCIEGERIEMKVAVIQAVPIFLDPGLTTEKITHIMNETALYRMTPLRKRPTRPTFT